MHRLKKKRNCAYASFLFLFVLLIVTSNACSHDAYWLIEHDTQPDSGALGLYKHDTLPARHYFQGDAYVLSADVLQPLHNDELLFRGRRDVGLEP